MSSILNNPNALSALQALTMTQQSLATVQNQVSTGLKVATAADNSSYWSIAAQLTADSGVVSASNDALSQGQSLLATASSAINSVITTINSIQTALTQATEPGANIGNINTSLAALGKQLTDAVNAASFNGLNVLNGLLQVAHDVVQAADGGRVLVEKSFDRSVLLVDGAGNVLLALEQRGHVALEFDDFTRYRPDWGGGKQQTSQRACEKRAAKKQNGLLAQSGSSF